MIKKIDQLFTGIPMTIVGGIFILLSLFLKLGKVEVMFDPAWISIIICGFPLLYLAIWRVIHNKGMNKISSALLISIAMIAAIFIGDIFAAGEVAFIMAIGGILEDKTGERAKKGLKKLISLTPQEGRLLIDGKEKIVPVEDVEVGNVLRVLPGESLPVDKEVGDAVFCGTMNRFGAIDIAATKVGENSSLQKLIQMVEDADNNKAPLERIADKWASWLVPAALLLAIITGLVTGDIVRAVTVLVVFCPCALVMATPTAIMAAIGQATKYGVIIKSGEAIERMAKTDCITFDKTGTLTNGNLVVSEVVSFHSDYSVEFILNIAASVEKMSEHPLAKAIVNFADEENQTLESVQNFKMIPGKGVQAKIGENFIFCGNSRWLQENQMVLSDSMSNQLGRFRDEGKAIVVIGMNDMIIGSVTLSDTLKESAKNTIAELNSQNIKSILLTGDHAKTANYFAQKVGITQVYSELLPEEKVAVIQELEEKGKNVCMIGDGVNDAPALKTATIGIAMGAMGSDIAVDAADIALMNDDITKIPYLERLSKATVKTIKGSIMLSLCINFVAIILSVTGILTPTTGALVHNVGSIIVVLIAALLYDRKFIDEDKIPKDIYGYDLTTY